MSAAATPPMEGLAGWRYPRITGERRKMGAFTNGRALQAVAWSVAALIVGLNGWLLVGTFTDWAA